MKIFFHIGLHKTGSSYIQKVLYNNSELLIQKNFFYKTNTPEEFNHNSLAELVLDFSKNKILLSDIFNRYINEALELKCHTIIFSSEMLAVRTRIAKSKKFLLLILRKPFLERLRTKGCCVPRESCFL